MEHKTERHHVPVIGAITKSPTNRRCFHFVTVIQSDARTEEKPGQPFVFHFPSLVCVCVCVWCLLFSGPQNLQSFRYFPPWKLHIQMTFPECPQGQHRHIQVCWSWETPEACRAEKAETLTQLSIAATRWWNIGNTSGSSWQLTQQLCLKYHGHKSFLILLWEDKLLQLWSRKQN